MSRASEITRVMDFRRAIQRSARRIVPVAGAGLFLLFAVDQASAQYAWLGKSGADGASERRAPLPPPGSGAIIPHSHGIGGGGGGGGGSAHWPSNVLFHAWSGRAYLPLR